MTDLDLAQTALAELRLTTLGYANAKKRNPSRFPETHTGKCEAALVRLVADLTPPPPPVPAPAPPPEPPPVPEPSPPPPVPSPGRVWARGGIGCVPLHGDPTGYSASYDVAVCSPGYESQMRARLNMTYFTDITLNNRNFVSLSAARAMGAVLRDANNQEVLHATSGDPLADPGHPGYCAAFAKNALAYAAKSGVEAYWGDDCVGVLGSLFKTKPVHADGTVWTDADLQAAYAVFFQRVLKPLVAAGLVVYQNSGFANDNDGSKTLAFWKLLRGTGVPPVTGFCREYCFQNGSLTPITGSSLLGRMKLVSWCEANGVGFMADDYEASSDPAGPMRARVCTLLETNGSALVMAEKYGDNSYPKVGGGWDADPGPVVDAVKHLDSDGWYRRRYKNFTPALNLSTGVARFE